jgi:hypothetical protein
MRARDEARRLRIRETTLADDLKCQISDSSRGNPSLLARTTVVSSYPTAAQCYFACQPAAVLGVEVEGGPGTISVLSSTFFALNVGSTIPPVGTQILATFAGNRWVFRYDA